MDSIVITQTRKSQLHLVFVASCRHRLSEQNVTHHIMLQKRTSVTQECHHVHTKYIYQIFIELSGVFFCHRLLDKSHLGKDCRAPSTTVLCLPEVFIISGVSANGFQSSRTQAAPLVHWEQRFPPQGPPPPSQ